MRVDYVDHMGSDLTVANAARVSFNKHKDEFEDSDAKLLGYLAKNNHWTPYSHPQITVRVKAPIFVARQLYKHKVGFTENEVSRRYVEDEPEFFVPTVWRGRPTNGAKQGSSEETIDITSLPFTVGRAFARALFEYNGLLEAGVAPEQARMVLPQAMYTEWYWTASLAAYARMCRQRLDSHAQGETREIAQMISDIIQPLFPISWEALTN